MLTDIEVGTVGTVIVKDMSRLGQNYLQVGFYTEMLFPQKGVRFIAINDNVDSCAENGEGDFTALRNLFNEWMVRDTGKKIRAVKRAKGLNGKPVTTPLSARWTCPMHKPDLSGAVRKRRMETANFFTRLVLLYCICAKAKA